jgi:hypothetical protein
MAQETLKITITADNKQAVQNIQQTVTATQSLGTAFQRLPNTSNQATYALSNLSRVAQDAPYGFIGIANNLNPLLESFQKLSKDAGGSGAALKAMAGSLMGPAGIGLALGAVSSIIVAFGPKIADFINGTNKASEAEDKFAKSLSDARAEASETGIRLQAYLTITQNANVSDERRAEALRAVKNELGKVNSAYASTITNVDQARAAVDLYTKALVAQAITSRYIDQIADKTVALNDVTKKALQAATDYNKASQKLAETPVPISDQIGVYQRITENAVQAGKVYTNFANETISLSSSITELNKDLENTIQLSLSNPFFVLDKGAKELSKSTKEVADNIQRIGGQARAITNGATAPILQQRGTPKLGPTPVNAPLGGRTTGFNSIVDANNALEAARAMKVYNMQLQFANNITDTITPAFEAMFQAMANGENIGKALEQSFKQIIVQLTTMIIKALIFKAVMTALGLPTMGGGGAGFTNFIPRGASGDGSGAFVLRGQDLLLATNRAQKASNLKGQNISLA